MQQPPPHLDEALPTYTPSAIERVLNDVAWDERPGDIEAVFPLFYSFVEQQEDMLCVYQPSGEIVYTNRSFAAFYGMRRSELVTLPLAQLTPVDHRADAEASLARIQALRPGDPLVKNLVEMTGADGAKAWVEWNDAPYFNEAGEMIVVVATGRDQTDRHLAEERLVAANRRLEESNRDLSDFAYVASHDLQEPLRKITTFSDRLTAKAADELSERNLDYLARINGAAGRMQRLIDDLLTFSRVTTQGEAFASSDLNEVVEVVLGDLEVVVSDSGATVDVDTLPVVDADETQMRQLFQNLIGNALKFRHSDRSPLVTIVSRPLSGAELTANVGVEAAKHDRWYRIVVADNGIGFGERHAEKIFTVFQRLHGRAEYEGSGIGLSVCRRIVERHGGRITASAVEGQGSEFVIILPGPRSDQP